MMKSKVPRLFTVALAGIMALALLLAACTPPAPAPTPPAGTTPQPAEFQWPRAIHVGGMGTSGQVKLISFTSVMEASTGSLIRVQAEDSYSHITRLFKEGRFHFVDLSASALANAVMGLDEYALSDGGPLVANVVWASSYGSTGFVVRGDSPIVTPRDIKPGMRMGIPYMTTGMMNPYLALLNWAGLTKDDVLWVVTGDTPGAVRAVVDGRADLAFAPPSGPYIYEAVAGPRGARFIDMNPQEDPEGGIRFTAIGPLYSLGPVENAPESIRGTWVMSSYRLLFAPDSTDADLIYNIVKWLDENNHLYKDAHEANRWMTLEHTLEALKTTYFPFHPGLQRYLEEKGVWTEAHAKRSQYNRDLASQYVLAYEEAKAMAAAQRIQISPANQKWIELWENYKAEKKLPLLRVHPGLADNAPVLVSPGYREPVPEPTPTPPPGPGPGVTGDVTFEFLSVTDPAGPAQKVVVIAKTVPGTEGRLKMAYSSGQGSEIVFLQPVQVADADGNIKWEGELHHTYVTRGTTTLTIALKAPDGKTGEAVTTFQIV